MVSILASGTTVTSRAMLPAQSGASVPMRRLSSRIARFSPLAIGPIEAQPPVYRELRQGARESCCHRAAETRAKGRRRAAQENAMPYHAFDDLPPSVRQLLRHAQEIVRAVFNSAWHSYDGRTASAPEETAFRVAWAAVKKRCRKIGDFWVGDMNRVPRQG
jgi:cation transport regulator